jgi:hypothetical protein
VEFDRMQSTEKKLTTEIVEWRIKEPGDELGDRLCLRK